MQQSESLNLVNRSESTLTASYYTEETSQTCQEDTLQPTNETETCTICDLNDFLQDADCLCADVAVLSQFHNDAINQAGDGSSQLLIFAVVGLILSADMVESLSVVFVLSAAEQELCLGDADKSWLGGAILWTMMIGSLAWGMMADKIGRRKSLLAAMALSTIFSAMAAFMPTYGLVALARFVSGFGIGGCVPVALVYLAEFLSRQRRAKWICLCSFTWSLGGVFVALVSWTIIPRTGLDLLVEKQQYFGSWRVLTLVCTFPSMVAVLGLAFVPESPRYFLEVGREMEALRIYQWMHRTNGAKEPTVQYQLSELDLPSRHQLLGYPNPTTRRLVPRLMNFLTAMKKSLVAIFQSPYSKTTLTLLVMWCATSFGYYGMCLWLPEHLKSFAEDSQANDAHLQVDELVEGIVFNASLRNVRFIGSEFRDVVFKDVILSRVIFENTTFRRCVFNNTRSSLTRFSRSAFDSTIFLDTDFYQFKFDTCLFHNTSFSSTLAGCNIDFHLDFDLEPILQQVLFANLILVPGAFLSAFAIDNVATRIRFLGASLLSSGFCAFFIWFLNTPQSVITFHTVFNFLFCPVWSCIQIITIEVFHTQVR